MFTYILMAALVGAVLFLTSCLMGLTKERDHAREEASALKEYKTEKEAYMMPVTQENIKDFLFDAPIDANIVDENTMTFDDGDLYIIDTARLPMLHIKTGIAIDSSYDKDMIEASADYVQNEVVMVETTVTEGKHVEFHISCCETCMGHLKESWQWYRDIMARSKDEFVHRYNHLHDNSRNDNYMKKDSTENQIQRATEQMVAAKIEEAEQNVRNQKPGGHPAS